MNDDDWLTSQFEEHRAHLRAVGYRMLGSFSEADDAVQETWLRLSRTDTSDVSNLGGWLTTVTARVCLNVLRSRRTRREDPLDVHVPDPIVRPVDDRRDPEEQAVLADSVGLALLVVLDALPPAERLAFVLHDLFAMPFEEIAPIASSPAGPGAGYGMPRLPMPTSLGNVGSWTPSWPPPATATSKRSSRSSIRRWCCGPTPEACRPRRSPEHPPRLPARCTAPRRSPDEH
jgi:RNA polymerase sigma factor (sigma-70 family)